MSEFVVICGGDGTRWGDNDGVRKHFAVVDGETVVDRTVRLFSPHGPVTVVIDERDADWWPAPSGARLEAVKRLPEAGGLSKFLDSEHLWSGTDRTVILYGDVWFSEEAAATIAYNDEPDFRLFARFGPSIWSGGGWGECFAFQWWPDHVPDVMATMWHVASLHRRAVIPRAGGWEFYQAWRAERIGAPVAELGQTIRIDDLTDDIDTPAEWERLCRRIEAHRAGLL